MRSLATLVLLAGAARADGPPLEPARVIGEVVGAPAIGVAVAAVGAAVSAWYGLDVDWLRGGDTGVRDGAYVGAIAGYLVAVPAITILISQTSEGEGSAAGAFIGAAVGAAPGLYLARDTKFKDWPVLLVGPVVGAVIGCNLERRYYVPEPIVAPNTIGLALAGAF